MMYYYYSECTIKPAIWLRSTCFKIKYIVYYSFNMSLDTQGTIFWYTIDDKSMTNAANTIYEIWSSVTIIFRRNNRHGITLNEWNAS